MLGITQPLHLNLRARTPMPVAQFVPPQFQVPPTLETEEFCLRMLTVSDVVKDYDAVMSSVAHCKTI